MSKVWGDIDKEWRNLAQRMTKIGIANPTDDDGSMLWLNVGGSQVNIRRSALMGDAPLATSMLATLFGVEWERNLPRDSDARMLLDENPVCVKYMLHNILRSGGRSIFGPPPSDDDIAADQKIFLPYVSSVLGLSEVGTAVSGGSTTLGFSEVGPLTTTIRSWCPGKPHGLKLLYRASRDGWTAGSFHSMCDSSASTITLVRVKARGSTSNDDSVVGGFSSVPWASTKAPASSDGNYGASPGSFLFMLKDGGGAGPSGRFLPEKWGVVEGEDDYAVYCGPSIGPTFGGGYDLHINWNGSTSTTFATHTDTYDIPDGAPFSTLTGRPVVEIEVFALCFTASMVEACPSEPECIALTDVGDSAILRSAGGSAEDEGDDIRAFGTLVAGSLMEERMALRDAKIELLESDAKVSAAAKAFAAVYGPHVAAGEEDPVVELNVRGSRVTTLLSTLRACPDSALAARFDKSKWPATEGEVDDQGRRMIDCSPSVFSKVLDVLRVRKRVAWAPTDALQQPGGDLVRVAVKAADREAFEEFVDKYFPGNLQSFVMDCVDIIND
eukprot:g16539.t1